MGGDGNSDGDVPETVVPNPPPVPVIDLTGEPAAVDLTEDSSEDEVHMSDDLSGEDDPGLDWHLVSRKGTHRATQPRGGR